MKFNEITENEPAQIRRWIIAEMHHQDLTHEEIRNIDIDGPHGIVPKICTFQNQLIVSLLIQSQDVLESKIKEAIASKIAEICQLATA